MMLAYQWMRRLISTDLSPECLGILMRNKMRKGGFAGGFFAIWVPSPIDMDVKTTQMNLPVYDLPLPPEIALDQAVTSGLGAGGNSASHGSGRISANLHQHGHASILSGSW
jgi:hypothetical protein